MLTHKKSGWGQQEASWVVTCCVRTRLSAGRQQRAGMKHFKRQIVRRKWFFWVAFFFFLAERWQIRFLGIQRGGCSDRRKGRGSKDGVCLQMGDGMRCDRIASQTLLASWWLHCTRKTQTNREAATSSTDSLWCETSLFFFFFFILAHIFAHPFHKSRVRTIIFVSKHKHTPSPSAEEHNFLWP